MSAAGAGITASCAGIVLAAPVDVPINQDLPFLLSSVPQQYPFDVDGDGINDVIFTSDFLWPFMTVSMSAQGVFSDPEAFDETSELSSPTGQTTTDAAYVFEFGELISANPNTQSVFG